MRAEPNFRSSSLAADLCRRLGPRRRMKLRGLIRRYEADGSHCIVPHVDLMAMSADTANYIFTFADLPVVVDYGPEDKVEVAERILGRR